MDVILKIDLDQWANDTWQKQMVDSSYVSSHHTDELLSEDTKKKWIDESFSLFNILNCRLQEKYKEDLMVILCITLNRSRKKGTIIKQITYNDYNNVESPPEFFLVSKKNYDFISYIKTKSQLIENTCFYEAKVYYMEEWNYGFDRNVWIYFES